MSVRDSFQRHNWLIVLIGTLLTLSGCASLIYQVTWVRLLGLSLGSTSASVSTVISAFFLGLALGSYLAERLTRNSGGSFVPYIAVEALIGISGLVSLPVLLNFDHVLALAPAIGSSLVLKFIASVLLLIIPTTCMGATFPIMASILVRSKETVGARLSQLYGLNTLGAVLGAGLSGFVFIPMFGLDGSIMTAVFFNALVVALALAVRAFHVLPPLEVQEEEVDEAAGTGDAPEALAVAYSLVVLFTTGFVSIATQVGWTKVLAIFVGSTIYGFSAILAIFLTGLTLGSLAFQRSVNNVKSPADALPWGLVALAAAFLFARGGLGQIPSLQATLNSLQLSATVNELIRYSTVAVLLLPPTIILGFLFPLNLRAYCGGLSGVRARVGKAYAVNTVAGIFGAVAAGFLLIPQFGTDFLLLAMALATLIPAMLWIPMMRSTIARVAVGVAGLITAAGFVVVPGVDFRDVIANAGYDSRSIEGSQVPEFLYLEEGKAGVISLTSYDGKSALLQNNGLNESGYHLEDDNYTQRAEALLSLAPFMIHEKPRSAFVVGFGAGHTTRILSFTDIERIKVVELEPAVVNAGLSIDSFVGELIDNPKVDLQFNDARNTLLLSPETYDLIVSQPSHPWVAGAANVFTKQFWEIGRDRLNDGGIFGQWINLFSMDQGTLESLLATFYSVFEHGFVIGDTSTGNLIAIGSNSPMTFDLERMDRVLANPDIQPMMAEQQIRSSFDIIWYYAFSRDYIVGKIGDVELNLDTNLLSEVELARRDGFGLGPDKDAYGFVDDNRTLDIAGFLPPSSIDRLPALGDYFLKWDNPAAARQVVPLLKDQAEAQADALTFKILLHEGRYGEAFDLFDTRDDWGDDIIEAYVNGRLLIGLDDGVTRALDKVSDPAVRDTLRSMLLYHQGRYGEVVKLSARPLTTRFWSALARASRDPGEAADQLAALAPFPKEGAVAATSILLRRAIEEDRRADVVSHSKELASRSDELRGLLGRIAETARESGHGDVADAAEVQARLLGPGQEVPAAAGP